MNENEYLEFIEQWKLEHNELIKSGKCKKVFLECLPKKYGFGANKNKLLIDWRNSIEYNIYFIYEYIEGYIKIINYINEKQPKIEIEYNHTKFKIATNHFCNCKLGNFLMKNTSEFKVEIGTIFKDEKRDIIITDRKKIKTKTGQWCKYYKYKCNKCGFDCGEHYKDGKYKKEHWMLETTLIGENETGCSCCCNPPQIAVQGINNIPIIAPWMVKYFQGGYDEAKKYNKSSNQSVQPICPDCGRVREKLMKCNTIYTTHSIGCMCSDKITYPEKSMLNILEQLGLKLNTQLSKSTFKWCKNYRYDFYFELNGEQFIIETHGEQHYKETHRKGAKQLTEEVANDRIKKELALSNGIKEENYITIDCRYSTLDWIKNNENGMFNSKLGKLFDLNGIDYLQVEEFTTTNLAKIACELKKNNPQLTTLKIGDIMGYHRSTITKWLKQGNELNWCHYNVKEESFKGSSKAGKSMEKYTEIFKEGMSLGVFKSARKIDKISEELFGIHLDYRGISEVAIGKKSKYKGYEFNYLTQEEYNRRVNEENLKLVI